MRKLQHLHEEVFGTKLQMKQLFFRAGGQWLFGLLLISQSFGPAYAQSAGDGSFLDFR